MVIKGVSRNVNEEVRFAGALARFVAAVQARSDIHFAQRFPSLIPDKFEATTGGPKYARVVRHGSQDSVYCFVRKEDGAVLKANAWKDPDRKHVRGSIYGDNPLDGTNIYGTNYIYNGGHKK